MTTVKTKKTLATSRRSATTSPTYLTKRVLVSAARAAGKEAATNAMRVMGYVVVVLNGAVVKKYADGRIEPIGPIANVKKATTSRR